MSRLKIFDEQRQAARKRIVALRQSVGLKNQSILSNALKKANKEYIEASALYYQEIMNANAKESLACQKKIKKVSLQPRNSEGIGRGRISTRQKASESFQSLLLR